MGAVIRGINGNVQHATPQDQRGMAPDDLPTSLTQDLSHRTAVSGRMSTAASGAQLTSRVGNGR